MKKNRKIFLLGIDGLRPKTFYHFAAGGQMPHFARLLDQAATLDMIPMLPALTVPGWLSIASGAFPSTIGAENILVPTPGKAPNVIRNGFNSKSSQVEYIWETLDRSGLNAIVLKYPGSWPIRPGNFLQIDGAGGYADITCEFEATSSQAYIAGTPVESNTIFGSIFPVGYENHWRIDRGPANSLRKVVTRDPIGWQNVPNAIKPLFEFVLHIPEYGLQAKKILYGLVYQEAEIKKVLLSKCKDFIKSEVHLTAGSWSGWLREESAKGPYVFRFKLINLNSERKSFHLYRSEGHRLNGFCRPATLAEELLREIGPMVEWTGTFDLMNSLVDLDTQFEIYENHTKWMIDTIRYLAERHTWHGFFTEWHVIEYAHHIFGASLHPEHPLHNPEKTSRDLDFLGRVYNLADQLLETVRSVIDDQTLLIVTGDHGHDLVHTIFYANHFLRRHGLLETKNQSGQQVIDWSKSMAYALFPGFIFLNIKGLWEKGIVREREIRPLVERITEALRSLVDPRTNRHPIKTVLERDELVVFGQAGPRAPDLFFSLDRGYESATRILHGAQADVEFEVTIPYREVTSGHGSFHPTSQSARTLAILSGPVIPSRAHSRYPVSVMDLAPTMTEFLGILPPLHCEGRAINLNKLVVSNGAD